VAEIKLQSAAFFQKCERPPSAICEGDEPTSCVQSSTTRWERIALWISRGTAAAVAVCVTALAVSFFAGIHLPKTLNPMDWWLRFGGAKPDQTFQQFIRDASARNQLDMDKNFRKSQLYQFEQSPNFQLNPQMTNWQFQSSPRNK
jgi:hypothetical protein